MTDPLQSPLAVLRAAFITLALAVHGLAAAPLPHAVTKQDLKNPVSAEEVERWASRLTAMGYAVTPEELSEQVISVTSVIAGIHRAPLKPLRPIFRLTGTGQGWGLFANPDNFPSRLEIRVKRADGTWSTVYRRLDPEHRWAVDLLTYRRVRGIYEADGFGKKPSSNYRRFADWIGERLLQADPDAQEVEVRMMRTHTTLRGQREDDRVEPRHEIIVRREP